MILNCSFIGVTFTHTEYIIYYVSDTIEIPETFMNSTLIFFGCGLYTKWKAESAKATKGRVERCKIR